MNYSKANEVPGRRVGSCGGPVRGWHKVGHHFSRRFVAVVELKISGERKKLGWDSCKTYCCQSHLHVYFLVENGRRAGAAIGGRGRWGGVGRMVRGTGSSVKLQQTEKPPD